MATDSNLKETRASEQNICSHAKDLNSTCPNGYYLATPHLPGLTPGICEVGDPKFCPELSLFFEAYPMLPIFRTAN
ncbi:hypothetical protein V6N13_119301 [Hibiscus sabdariffa]